MTNNTAFWCGERVTVIKELPADTQGIRDNEEPEPVFVIVDSNGKHRQIMSSCLDFPPERATAKIHH